MGISDVISTLSAGKEIYMRLKELKDRRKLKNKYIKIRTMKDELINGVILDYMRVGEKHYLKVRTIEEEKELMISIDNIYYFEIMSSRQQVEEQYIYGLQVRYTFDNFPTPFIGEEGLDVVFVYGTSSIDYDDYRTYMQSRGEKYEVRTAFQRMGDFDPLLTLVAKFGYYTAMEGFSSADMVCYGRLDFALTEEERRKHNLICVGSGYTNYVTREMLNYYYKLPIRFETPSSHQAILRVREDGEIKVYDRTLTGKHAGIAAILPNPYNPVKVVLIAAGLRSTGTQAAILALCDIFEKKKWNLRGRNIYEILVEGKRIENIMGKEVVRDYEIIDYAELR